MLSNFSQCHGALWVAKDPVAADFFKISIHADFDHLFGWDFNKKDCNGGILDI